jgi:hypothetical protein
MPKFALLDTPEYAGIVGKMLSVSNRLEFSGVHAYDINSDLVFEFSFVEDAIEHDNGKFIIFDYDNESTHSHKNNFRLLAKIMIADDSKPNKIVDTVDTLLQSLVPNTDQLVDMITNVMCRSGSNCIEFPMNGPITIAGLRKLVMNS